MENRGYLIIFEEDDFTVVDNISNDLIESTNNGYCSIINLNDITYFRNGSWIKVEKEKL